MTTEFTYMDEPVDTAIVSTPKKMRRKMLAIGVTSAMLVATGGLGYLAYTAYQDHKAEQAAEQALAEAQAEFDAFDAETEDVWSLFVELEYSVKNGVSYREHDDLVSEITRELSRVDVEGDMAESVVEDMEGVLEEYAEANKDWNEYIYDDGDEDAQQVHWLIATVAWNGVQDEVEKWADTLASGELPASTSGTDTA